MVDVSGNVPNTKGKTAKHMLDTRKRPIYYRKPVHDSRSTIGDGAVLYITTVIVIIGRRGI